MFISDKNKIKDIQRKFNHLFPHLKLKFYKLGHKDHEGSRAGEEWDLELTIGEIRTSQKNKELHINENLQVQELEEEFKLHYGLNVQVFRESTQGIWLQTISTDDWTLKAQNERAESELSA